MRLEQGEWHREGRGRSLEIFCDTDELVDILRRDPRLLVHRLDDQFVIGKERAARAWHINGGARSEARTQCF